MSQLCLLCVKGSSQILGRLSLLRRALTELGVGDQVISIR